MKAQYWCCAILPHVKPSSGVLPLLKEALIAFRDSGDQKHRGTASLSPQPSAHAAPDERPRFSARQVQRRSPQERCRPAGSRHFLLTDRNRRLSATRTAAAASHIPGRARRSRRGDRDPLTIRQKSGVRSDAWVARGSALSRAAAQPAAVPRAGQPLCLSARRLLAAESPPGARGRPSGAPPPRPAPPGR